MKRRRSNRLSAVEREREGAEAFREAYIDHRGDYKAMREDERVKGMDGWRHTLLDLYEQTRQSFTDELLLACKEGDLVSVEQCAHLGDINGCLKGRSPLTMAIKKRNKGLATYLLSHPDVNVNHILPNGKFALYEAIQERTDEFEYEYVDMVLEHPSANVNIGRINVTSTGFADNSTQCVFVAAVEDDDTILKRLFKHSSFDPKSICTRGDWMRSPFLVACSLGHLDAVKEFMSSPGFELKKHKSVCRATTANPIMLACESGNLDLIKYLLDAEPFPEDWNESKAWDRASFYVAAAFHDRANVLEFLLEEDRVQVTPQHKQLALNAACKAEAMSALEFLLSRPDVDLTHPELLSSACDHLSVIERLLGEEKFLLSPESICEACAGRRLNAMRMLLADPRGSKYRCTQNAAGNLPAHLLVRSYSRVSKRNALIEEAFLAHPDFQINQVDGSGNSLLMVAIEYSNWGLCTAILSRDDVDVNIQNKAGKYAMHIFRCRGEECYMKLLKYPGVDINAISIPSPDRASHSCFSLPLNRTSYYPEALEYILSNPSLSAEALNLRIGPERLHPLWHVALQGDTELMKKVLEHPYFDPSALDELALIPRSFTYQRVEYSGFCGALFTLLKRGDIVPSAELLQRACDCSHVTLAAELLDRGMELPDDVSPGFKNKLLGRG